MEDETTNEQLASALRTIKALGEFAKRLANTNMRERVVGPFEIDGLRYTSTKLPATVGLELIPRITALLGAAFKPLALGSVEGISPEILIRIADRAMRDGLPALAKDLLSRVEVNELAGIKSSGKVVDDFDDHFAGEYMHLLRVCLFALVHNFRGPSRGVS